MTIQLDLFEDTVGKKIHRLEKWIGRLHRELHFLKDAYAISQASRNIPSSQLTLFEQPLYKKVL